MFSNNESVLTYATRVSKTPEGILVMALALSYFLAFILFATLSDIAAQYAISLNGEHRVAFVLMPFLLLVVLLRMDFTAGSAGDRLLTIVAILFVASVPLYRIFFF